MYEELVKTLRLRATLWEKMYDEDTVLKQAADAIEELEKDLERSKEYETFWNKEAEEALRRFQVAVANKPRWIPVKEQLPEERMAVIVYAPYMKNEFMAYWTGSRWMVWAAGEYEREMPEYHQITHWMPLPKPPKEET